MPVNDWRKPKTDARRRLNNHFVQARYTTDCRVGVHASEAGCRGFESHRPNGLLESGAVYARERAYMKDMPAALLVTLSTRDTVLMHKVFDRVADNGRVLRTVFQMTRSGQFGRKGLSSSLQRAFQRRLNDASVGKLLSSSIGNDPGLRDILRMARPTLQ